MAVKAETLILHPFNLSSKAFTHRHTCTHTLNNAIEIKVVYVRIITSTPMQSTITMAFPAGEDDDRSLTVNGKAAVPVVLKRNRVDGAMGESVYVNTDFIRFSGSCLGFEIRVREACSALVVGAVGRKADGRWVVQGREGGGGQETGVDGAVVDVYFVGRRMGRAVVLNRVVEMRKTRKGLDCIPACDDEVATDDSEVSFLMFFHEENGPISYPKVILLHQANYCHLV